MNKLNSHSLTHSLTLTHPLTYSFDDSAHTSGYIYTVQVALKLEVNIPLRLHKED